MVSDTPLIGRIPAHCERVHASPKLGEKALFMIDRTAGTSPAQQEPILWWFFDSDGYPPQPAHGGWHNGELILEKITPRGVAEHRFVVADGQLSYRVRLRPDQASQLQDLMSGTYRRFSGH